MGMNRRRLIIGLPLLSAGMVCTKVGSAAAPALRVGAALPDPPFEFMTDAGPAGFDVTLMRRMAERLGRAGADFNGLLRSRRQCL
jgi:ABC-type amino acid transport substrate-binding protein